mmetsp:Transcript_15276/g.41066  ORF Transcript_15276/g.41066 Transcript_15276/m.41066 type:complete len:298 (+) Transcript_15276:1400-2293(+)
MLRGDRLVLARVRLQRAILLMRLRADLAAVHHHRHLDLEKPHALGVFARRHVHHVLKLDRFHRLQVIPHRLQHAPERHRRHLVRLCAGAAFAVNSATIKLIAVLAIHAIVSLHVALTSSALATRVVATFLAAQAGAAPVRTKHFAEPFVRRCRENHAHHAVVTEAHAAVLRQSRACEPRAAHLRARHHEQVPSRNVLQHREHHLRARRADPRAVLRHRQRSPQLLRTPHALAAAIVRVQHQPHAALRLARLHRARNLHALNPAVLARAVPFNPVLPTLRATRVDRPNHALPRVLAAR